LLIIRVSPRRRARHRSLPQQCRASAQPRALTTLSQINSQMNPFRFIVYSEWSGKALAPVSPQ